MELSDYIHKADVLIEALPYIADFKDEMIVVKLGGSVQEDPKMLASTMMDIAFMSVVGMLPIVVHGGGKAISRALKESGLESRFVQGFRVTDEASMKIVEDVIKNQVSPFVASLLPGKLVESALLPGDRIFFTVKKTGIDPETGETLDWGYVGTPMSVDTGPVREILRTRHIPVICPLGRGADGHVYNINADTAAAALAKALPSRKLAYVSDVPGLLRNPADPASLIPTLPVADVPGLIEDGTISGGMIPKIESSLEALRAGVRKVHMVDGRMHHSLLLEMFTTQGVGTQIVKQL